jgi:hypothetical protein
VVSWRPIVSSVSARLSDRIGTMIRFNVSPRSNVIN